MTRFDRTDTCIGDVRTRSFIKLLMNATIGMLNVRSDRYTQTIFSRSEAELLSFVCKYSKKIVGFDVIDIGEGRWFCRSEIESKFEENHHLIHSSLPHISSFILARSKMIMHRYMMEFKKAGFKRKCQARIGTVSGTYTYNSMLS